jgi:hypothetical protein
MVKVAVQKLIHAMVQEGFDPVVYESKRTIERQKWLYGVGRTHDMNRKPITWTMNSLHLAGKACDIISKAHGWNDPAFFLALKKEAVKVGLTTIPQEGCHVQL